MSTRDQESLNNSGPITCHLLTYNIAGKPLLTSHLRAITSVSGDDAPGVIDVFAFAFQECPKKWSQKAELADRRLLNKKLAQCLRTHQMIKDCSIGGLHLVIFVRTELIQSVTDKETFSKSVSKFSRVYRTKGAVAIAFRLYERPLLFINCHFRFGRSFQRRRQDFRHVVDSLSFANYPIELNNNADTLSPFECVFLFGDINTRFVNAKIVEKLLHRGRTASDSDFHSGNARRLLKLDQLHLEMQKPRRRSFEHFFESAIHFAPTYKYIIDSWIYNWKRRTPAYTDRILYRRYSSVSLRCSAYDAIKIIRISDHLPVFATFEVTFL